MNNQQKENRRVYVNKIHTKNTPHPPKKNTHPPKKKPNQMPVYTLPKCNLSFYAEKNESWFYPPPEIW